MFGNEFNNHRSGYGLLSLLANQPSIKHRVFYSFHYKNDAMRAAVIKNIGALDGNMPCSPNEWEEVKKSDNSIKQWINNSMEKRTCCIVLVGTETSGRKWIKYEIKTAWEKGLGVLGIFIHNIKIPNSNFCAKGKNPFVEFTFGKSKFSDIVKCYDPKVITGHGSYHDIASNISAWIEEAISIRKKYS